MAVKEAPMVLKGVGVFSAAKIFGLLYTAMGFLIGLIFSLVALVGAAAGGLQNGPGRAAFGMLFGVGAVVAFPLLYGVIGFVAGLISAGLYNVLAKFVGGIELHLE